MNRTVCSENGRMDSMMCSGIMCCAMPEFGRTLLSL